MALGNESPKEFLFGVLEDLSQDLGFWNCLQLSIVDINWMAGSIFGGISYNVSTIFAKSREKSHRLWTKNLSLARGLLALQIKIPLGIHFLGP